MKAYGNGSLIARHGSLAAAARFKDFGLTDQDVGALLETQDGKCAVCRCPLVAGIGPEGIRVDHDHGTGAVRALLCLQCNTGLGLFRDDPQALRAATQHLSQLQPSFVRVVIDPVLDAESEQLLKRAETELGVQIKTYLNARTDLLVVDAHTSAARRNKAALLSTATMSAAEFAAALGRMLFEHTPRA